MRNLIKVPKKASAKTMATVNEKITRHEQSKTDCYFLTECRTPSGRLILSEGETEQQSKEGVKEIQLARFIKRQQNIRQHDDCEIKMMTVNDFEAPKKSKTAGRISRIIKSIAPQNLVNKAV